MKPGNYTTVNVDCKESGKAAETPETAKVLPHEEVNVATAELVLRLRVTKKANRRTEDRLEWASSIGGPFTLLPGEGKVIVATFADTATTKVTILATAFEVVEDTGAANPIDVSLAIYDSELNRERVTDRDFEKKAYTFDTGKFDLIGTPPKAFHEVNVNMVIQLDSQFFVFDPLIIIVPKRT